MKKALELRQITVAAGECPASPIELILTGCESSADVRIGRGAKAIIFDASTSEQHEVNVTLEAESELLYVSLSAGSTRTFRSTLAEGASIHWHCTTLGAATDSHTLVSRLSGRNARSDIDWAFRVGTGGKQTISAKNLFEGESGGGEITMKGIAEGTGFASVNGMIEIAETGRGTQTFLTEDVLMLDPTAKVDAIPGLEIRTNDVKASHSATVSRVTLEDLFYMQSRGIDPAEARAMFIRGFLATVIDRLDDPVVREEVFAALDARMKHSS